MSSSLFLLDGHGLIFRSYYAHIRNPLRNSKGENTSAVYGFFQGLQKIYQKHGPQNMVIALDADAKLERAKIYPQYKANRQKTPEDLKSQIKIIRKIIQEMKIPHLSIKGVEADDIIATLSRQAEQKNMETVIVSSDKDLFQLLGPTHKMLRPSVKSSDWEEVNPDWVKEHYGIQVEQVHDYLAIVGDSSDNIPGVAGIGPKGAVALLEKYKTLEGIFEHVDEIKESWREKLLRSKDLALLSYTLIALDEQVPLPSDFDSFYPELLWDNARELFLECDIKTYLNNRSGGQSSGQGTSAQDSQTDYAEKQAEPAKSKLSFQTIDDIAILETLVSTALSQKYISLQPVYAGKRALHAEVLGLALSTEETKAYYLPLQTSDTQLIKDEKSRKKCYSLLQKLFHDKDCLLISFDAKQALTAFHGMGFSKKHNSFHMNKASVAIFDVLIAAWVCSPSSHAYTLLALCKQYNIDVPIEDDKEILSMSDVAQLSPPEIAEQSGIYATLSLLLYRSLKQTLQTVDAYDLFISVEMHICWLLSKIEQNGIMLDVPYIQKLSAELETLMQDLKQQIYSLSGEEFNINSPKQLQKILFEKLQLPTGKKTQTGFSTDVQVLEFLSSHHDLPKKILEFRHVSKLKNTYSDTLPSQIDDKTKRIHTSLNQNGSETGRMSSTNPNLQNIPVKDALGQRLRKSFVSSKGHVLVSADYNQIELVVLAHLSKDKTMQEAFANGVDIHTRTASILFQKEEIEIDESQRRIAKSINFGVVYGMSAFRLGNELKIPHKLAREFIESYFTEFSSVTQFVAETIKNTEKTTYSSTILGRRRYLEHINSSNKNLKHAADRMAVNSTIQGSASDIMKLAMIRVDEVIRKESLSSIMLLQIHDELLFECPLNEVEALQSLLHTVMPSVYTLSIPLSISTHSGKNWGELK